MKANLKGLSGIKGLLLLHGEKIGIAVVGALALWFIYSSLSLPKLESQYEASNLQTQISQTNTEIQNFDWEAAVRDHGDKMRVAKPITKSADLKVDPKPFEIVGLDAPVITPTVLRADPVLLNAIDVRAIGGSGLLAFSDEATRKRQAIKLATEQAEQEKKRAKEAEQNQNNPEGPGGGRGGRGGRGGPEDGMTEVDPRFPNRRLVEGMSMQGAGVPTQGFERIERASWAMVVAKVPIREQLKLYQDAFQNARGGFTPDRDFPRYAGFVVERAEVVGGKLTPWQRVSLYDGQQKSILANKPIERGVTINAINRLLMTAQTEWAGMPIEPVDSRYKNYVLTLPLGPLVGRDWSSDATHPDIPLAVDAPLTEQEVDQLAKKPEEEAAASDDELSFDSADQTQMAQNPYGTAAGPAQYAGPAGPGFAGRGGEFGSGMNMYSARGGPEMGRGEFAGGMMGGGGMPSEGQATSLPRGVNYYLLRFCDFTVEPGKKYKYRVKLALLDPNFGLPDNVLEQNVQDRQRKEWQAVRAKLGDKAVRPKSRLVEEYSEPSPTVGIPLSGSVWLAEAAQKNEKLHNDEPMATIWAETFDIDQDGLPINIAQEEKVRRGAVINVQDKMQFSGESGRWIDEFEDAYKLYTGYTLLDVDGADRLSRDMTAPSRALIMGPAGEMMIRTETDDRDAVRRLKFIFAKKKGRGRDDMQGGPGEFGRPGFGQPGRGGRGGP